MRANTKRSLAPAVVTALLLGSLIGCGGEHGVTKHEELAPLPVKLQTAAADTWRDEIEVTASVQPSRRAAPGTVLMGRVEELLRDEGDAVRRGQPLARIESRDVAARLAQAEAAVAAARAMEHNAGLMRDRMERLFDRQAASRRNLDDAIAGHDAAAANLGAAEEAVKAAQVYVEYAEVRAPFDGVVTERRVQVGDTAAPGMPLFVIEDLAEVKVEAQLPESVAVRLSIGDPVEVEVHGELRGGELTELLPAADPRSRTFTVRARLDNRDGRLRSGAFARMRIGGEPETVLTVPEASLVRRGPLTGLFVADSEAIARLRWVTLGRERAGAVEILTGLEDGERFVAEPVSGLRDGRRLEVM